MTLKELYARVAAAVEAMPAHVKADVDAAFAEHAAAADTPQADPVPEAPAAPAVVEPEGGVS